MASTSSVENLALCVEISKLQNGRSEEGVDSAALHIEQAREDDTPTLENGRSEERVDTVVVHKELAPKVGEQRPNGILAQAEMMMARIGTCLESMEVQMGITSRLLEQLVKETKGLRDDLKISRAKEVQLSTARFDKLLAEQTRTNDLIEKALYGEPSSSLFANSKDRHPHKAYLRVMLEDLEAMKRKLR